MASIIEFKGLDEFQKKLEALRTDNPGFEKRLRGVIRKVLSEVRKRMSKDARSGLQMKSDPRNAYKAVRMAVYRRIFGGQVNILQSHRVNGGGFYYEPQRHPSRVGGNRRPQSMRTKKVMSYEGVDRGFILRFLNQGTTRRNIEHLVKIKRADGTSKYRWSNDKGTYGNRGAISSRNWFGPRSYAELQNAAGNIQDIIDKVINDEFI